MSSGAVDDQHQPEADQSREELHQARTRLVLLGTEEFEEDDVQDRSRCESLQDSRGQQTAAARLLRTGHHQTQQHAQRRGQREDAEVGDDEARGALRVEQLFADAEAHDRLMRHDGREEQPHLTRRVLERRCEALEHRMHREGDHDQVGAEGVLAGDVSRVVVPAMIVHVLLGSLRRVLSHGVLLTSLTGVRLGPFEFPAPAAHHAGVCHLLDEEHHEEADAEEQLSGRYTDIREQPGLLDLPKHLPHLGQHVREDGGEQHSGAKDTSHKTPSGRRASAAIAAACPSHRP